MNAEETPGGIPPVRFVPTQDQVDRRPWHQRYRAQLVAAAGFLGVAVFLWFIFTAKSVRILTEPPNASVSVHGGPAFTIGSVHVLRSGDYRLTASAEGYHDLEAPFTVGDDRNQTFEFELEKLPGKITFVSDP